MEIKKTKNHHREHREINCDEKRKKHRGRRGKEKEMATD